MEIFYDPADDRLKTLRFATATGDGFFVGMEICDFIPAVVGRPYYIFSGIKDGSGEDRKWFLFSSANSFAEPATANQGDIFNSPLREGFQIIPLNDVKRLMRENLPSKDAEVGIIRFEENLKSMGFDIKLGAN